MRVWIVNYYTGTPDKVSNPRYIQLAKHFMAAGYDVLTINANHTWDETNKPPLLEFKNYGEYKFVHVRARKYVGNGLRRMLSIYQFAQDVKHHSKKIGKPDIVLHNIHPPFDYPIVGMAKIIGAKYIAEAWDLWPQDFVTFGLISEKNPMMKVAYMIEKRYYYNADELVFTFKGCYDYLKRKGWTTETGGKIDISHVHYINNGIDLKQFDEDVKNYPRPDADINEPDKLKIVYLGSIRRANHVQTLIDAAATLQNNPRYQFFIYGDGNQREELIQYVQEKGIKNVVFKEKRIPLCDVAWVVSQATVNVMNYEKGFGHVGVSSGKMFQYLAAGKPIVCNIDISYDDVITDYRLGIAHDMETAEEFAKAIRQIAEQPKTEYEAMCSRVRETAQCFDYQVLAAREIEVLKAACKE